METSPPLTSAATAPDAEDAHKIGHKSARSPRIEVITRGERRRVWTVEQKREIVAESFGPDLTPTEVVRKYGISSGQLYTWRHRMLSGPTSVLSRAAPSFAQVDTLPAPQPSPTTALPPSGIIEIVLANGVTLRVDAHVDSQALRRVLAALSDR
jgi:transposase